MEVNPHAAHGHCFVLPARFGVVSKIDVIGRAFTKRGVNPDRTLRIVFEAHWILDGFVAGNDAASRFDFVFRIAEGNPNSG